MCKAPNGSARGLQSFLSGVQNKLCLGCTRLNVRFPKVDNDNILSRAPVLLSIYGIMV